MSDHHPASSRTTQELASTFYAAAMAYWFSTIPHTSSIVVFAVFLVLDVVWFLATYLAREWS